MSDEDRGTLKQGEAHPSSFDALKWLRSLSMTEIAVWQSSFASVALSGNRLAEICSETLNRLSSGLPVSDRYLLGLAWAMRSAEVGDGTGKKRTSTAKKGRAAGKGKGHSEGEGVGEPLPVQRQRASRPSRKPRAKSEVAGGRRKKGRKAGVGTQ